MSSNVLLKRPNQVLTSRNSKRQLSAKNITMETSELSVCAGISSSRIPKLYISALDTRLFIFVSGSSMKVFKYRIQFTKRCLI
jgi:hypothetical protein